MKASKVLYSIFSNTKEEELHILQGFLLRLQYESDKIEPSEQPDIEVESAGKRIGVEVTKYFGDLTKKGSPKQKKISNWKSFAESLKRKLSEISAEFDYLNGVVHFHSDINEYSYLLKKEYFNELHSLIEMNLPEIGKNSHIELSAKQHPFLSKSISAISLSNQFPEKMDLWWDSRIQSGAIENKEESLDLIIDRKEKSAKKYRQDYFQKWLVIYAGGLGLSDIYVDDVGRAAKKTEGVIASVYFTHIFIWDKFSEVIYQLHPYHKKIFDVSENALYVNHLPIRPEGKE